jgi:hypothetical protein
VDALVPMGQKAGRQAQCLQTERCKVQALREGQIHHIEWRHPSTMFDNSLGTYRAQKRAGNVNPLPDIACLWTCFLACFRSCPQQRRLWPLFRAGADRNTFQPPGAAKERLADTRKSGIGLRHRVMDFLDFLLLLGRSGKCIGGVGG